MPAPQSSSQSSSQSSQKERMLAGEPYQADDPELAADLLRAALLMERYNASSVADGDARDRLDRPGPRCDADRGAAA